MNEKFQTLLLDSTETMPRTSGMRRIIKIMSSRQIVIVGVIIMVILLFAAIFAPLISPYDPLEQDLDAVLTSSSGKHLLGTDQLGRDTLSRIIYGCRISLFAGIFSVIIAAFFGITMGLIAGFFRGWLDIIIMRFTDALLALPPLILIMAIAAIIGGGILNVMIAVGVGLSPTYTRLMYGQVLSISEDDYVTAARSIGANSYRIMLRHILPNSFPTLLVLITMNMGIAIMMEASLSFIGVGISPPTPTWGSMISEGYRYLTFAPFLSMIPGIAILLVVLSCNIVGDGLRDALDPRLRGML